MSDTLKQKISVIYIIGAGKSGSTVLDTILGNHPEIESVGELARLPQNAWINGEYCSCGQPGNTCPFWTEVMHEWTKIVGGEEINALIKAQSYYEGHLGLYRLKRDRTSRNQRLSNYISYTHAIFKAIRTVSGCHFIVDSSKIPSRAYSLSLIPDIDLYLIHMVRDIRGVSWSLGKSFKKNVEKGIEKDKKGFPKWRSSITWIVQNSLSEIVIHQLPNNKSIIVRYEDLMNDSHKELDRIGNLTGIDFQYMIDLISTQKPLLFGHTIAGNRLRMNEHLFLRFDEDWKNFEVSVFDHLIFKFVAGNLMQKYKYNL